MADCKRCGWCCKNVNINITFGDILRWAKDRRFDILAAISYIDHEDEGHRGFYITDTVAAPKKRCPFFNRGTCSIYDTRPRACAEFPQSLTDEQGKRTECPALDEQRIPEGERFELCKWQSLDFVIAEKRRDDLIAILAKAREVMALSEEIYEFGLDPTESLWVDGFDNSKAGWTTVGGSPYLDAQDQPANYVWTTTKKAQSGDYSFDDTARPATDTLVGVDLYVYGQSSANDTFYLWDGGWNNSGIGVLPGAWGWINVAVDAILDTWAKVDGAALYIAHSNSANRSDVDAAYLLVEYTPVHLGAAALSGTGSLTAIGNVVGGVVTGAAALSGTGALSAIGQVTAFGVAALSGTGTLSAIAIVISSRAAALSGTGALSAAGNVIKPGVAALSGTGSLTAVGNVVGAGVVAGVAALSGTGALSAIGQVTAFGAVNLTGTGALSAVGLLEAIGAAALSGTGALSAQGLQIAPGVAALSGTGDLAAIGNVVGGAVTGVAALSGTGALSAVALLTAIGVAALSGTGSLSATGDTVALAGPATTGTADGCHRVWNPDNKPEPRGTGRRPYAVWNQ